MASVLLASIAGPIRPRAFLAVHEGEGRPWSALAVLLAGTVASAALLVPFMWATIDAAPIPRLDPAAVTRIIWFTVAAMAPLGALLTMFVLAALIWTVPVFAGYEIRWRGCVVVATLAAAVDILQRLFVVGVLWLREWTGLTDPRYDVRTGLDAFMGHPGPLLDALCRHAGVFQIWVVVMVVIGLTTLERLPRRVAIVTALVASLVFNGVLVMLEGLG